MSRRRAAEKREILPDPKYKDLVLAKFTNSLMRDGMKSVAETILYRAFDDISQRSRQDPVKVFHEALENVRPAVEVRSRRVGGANYQVPMSVTSRRRQSLAFRWILQAARGEKGKPMFMRLARELYDAANGDGKAISTRENTHRMAEANKAFAHFAW